MIPEGPWPLSAAATAVLLEPDDRIGREVFKLALRELIGRGAWRARTETSTSRLGRRRTTVVLRPGPRPTTALPSPLDRVESAIRPVRLDRAGELPLGRAGAALRDAEGKEWAHALVEATREELEASGLLERTTRRLRADRWTRTPDGDAWAAEAAARCMALRDDLPRLAATDRPAAAALIGSAAWLVLRVPEAAEHVPALRTWEQALDEEERRGMKGLGYAFGGYGGGAAAGGAHPELDDVPDDIPLSDSAFDGGFDSAFDGAFASGDLGSGFDGGGGGFFDGGGGGGDGGGGGGN